MNATASTLEKIDVFNFEEVEPGKLYDPYFPESILDASMDGIFVAGAVQNDAGRISDFVMKKINPAFTRMRKLEKEQVIGNRYLSLFPTARDSGMFEMYCGVIESGKPARDQFHFQSTTLDAWYEVSAVKLGSKDIVVSFHDHTMMVQLQNELKQKIKELTRLNRNLEHLIFAASHNLKEPLRKVLLYGDRLKNSMSKLAGAEAIKSMNCLTCGIQRMWKLVDGLLACSDINFEPAAHQLVDLNLLMADVLSDLELALIEKGALVHMEVLPEVYGNYHEFYQLFQNLVENSLKFCYSNRPLDIFIRAHRIKDIRLIAPELDVKEGMEFYQFEVKDNGIGFNEAYADMLFDVFQRFHSDIPGAGLGLFIARRVVEKYGGSISARGGQDMGTQIQFVLPLKHEGASGQGRSIEAGGS